MIRMTVPFLRAQWYDFVCFGDTGRQRLIEYNST